MEAQSIRRMGAGALPGLAALVVILICAGCAGSTDKSGRGDAAVPDRTQPAGESGRRQAPDFPPGKFTVQLGAYQSEEGAEKIASLTRSRYTKEVYIVFNDADALYKVMLGIFDTKDQARGFRDTIVGRYPDDYKDAWVSELTR